MTVSSIWPIQGWTKRHILTFICNGQTQTSTRQIAFTLFTATCSMSLATVLHPMPTSSPEIKKKNWWTTPLIPYVPQPKGTPWYAVNWGATIFFFSLPLWYGVVFFVGVVNQVPERAELQTLFGKVIQTHRLTPHLLIQLPDGQLKSMEFPVYPSLMGGGGAYVGWREDVEAKQLIGCNVEVHGVPMKWTFDNRFRVFELVCLEKHIGSGGLEYSKKTLQSEQWVWIVIFFVTWFLALVPLFVFVLNRERKFYRE